MRRESREWWSSLVFSCCDKTLWLLQGGDCFFGLHLQATIHAWGKGRNSRPEPKGRNHGERMLAGSCLSNFPIRPRITCTWNGAATVIWILLQQLPKLTPTDVSTGQTNLGSSFTKSSPPRELSDVSMFYLCSCFCDKIPDKHNLKKEMVCESCKFH